MLVAGVFLREFVAEGVQWAHIDIAGPAYNTSGPWGYTRRAGRRAGADSVRGPGGHRGERLSARDILRSRERVSVHSCTVRPLGASMKEVPASERQTPLPTSERQPLRHNVVHSQRPPLAHVALRRAQTQLVAPEAGAEQIALESVTPVTPAAVSA